MATLNPSEKRSGFSIKVIRLIQKIPRGRVATYGQIAALAGKPHAARGVSWILHSSSKAYDLPWHRVIGSKGRISFPKSSKHYLQQIELLKREHISLLENGDIDLTKYQWAKKPPRERRPRAIRR